MSEPDLEKPYQDAAKREDRLEVIKDREVENFWYEITEAKFADKLIYDWLSDPTELLAVMLKKIGNFTADYGRIGRNAFAAPLGAQEGVAERLEVERAECRRKLIFCLKSEVEKAFDSYLEKQAESVESDG